MVRAVRDIGQRTNNGLGTCTGDALRRGLHFGTSNPRLTAPRLESNSMGGSSKTSHKQHVDIHRKILLRRSLLDGFSTGAVYLPFCGDGDIAWELYGGHLIDAIDKDDERVASFRSRFPHARTVAGAAETWQFGKENSYAVADFDAWARPYAAFSEFWIHAEKEFPLVMFFTDGHRATIQRKKIVQYPGGESHSLTNREVHPLFNGWFDKVVIPWFDSIIAPARRVKTKHYYRRYNLYWGTVVEQ